MLKFIYVEAYRSTDNHKDNQILHLQIWNITDWNCKQHFLVPRKIKGHNFEKSLKDEEYDHSYELQYFELLNIHTSTAILIYGDIIGLISISKDLQQSDKLLQNFMNFFRPLICLDSVALQINLTISDDQKLIALTIFANIIAVNIGIHS